MKAVRKLAGSKDAATGIEYGLIAGLIAVAIIGSLGLLGNGVDGIYADWTQKVINAIGDGE